MDKDTDLHCDDGLDDSDTEMMIMMTITLTIWGKTVEEDGNGRGKGEEAKTPRQCFTHDGIQEALLENNTWHAGKKHGQGP